MSVPFHLMLWLMLPAALYATLWAYGEWRQGR